MGQNILTPHQYHAVELAQASPIITDRYYLTGGTALAAFYLKHRLSEDLDFFTSHDVNVTELQNFFTQNASTLDISSFSRRDHYNMVFYYLTFSDRSILKVDFVNLPYPQVERGTFYKGLSIDSIFDIALNKFYTMADRPRARDFVDLYFILTTQGVSLEQLYMRMNDKFYPFTQDDAVSFLAKVNRVADVTNEALPTMLIPFDRQKMVNFFLAEAKKFEKKIFK